MKKTAILALGLFVLWLLMSGHYTALVTTFGVLSSVGVAVLAYRFGILGPEGRAVSAYRFASYLPWLAKEVIASNIVVAKALWNPSLPIQPQIVRGRTTQRTSLGLAVYANSITLTPGTLSLDADEPGIIVCHALTDATADGVREGEMDRRVTAIESSEAVPAKERCA